MSRLQLLCLYLASFVFQFLFPLSSSAQLQQEITQDAFDSSSLIIPNDTFKFLLAPLQSSNRIEYNHYLPLLVYPRAQLFIDNTFYVKQRPIETDDINSSYVQSIGDSVRIGYRELLKGSDSFWGVNFGYDNALQSGYYYQQLGVGIEVTSPNFQFVSTFAAPIGNLRYLSPGKAILSPFNIQITVPTGIKSLVFLPRFYYVSDSFGASAPGGQLQLNYHFNPRLKLSLSTSYDQLSGSGGALELFWRPNVPVAPSVGSPINPSILGSYAGPVGNNGTRIVRLTGSDPAYGD
jgi:hypothetical protein